MNSQQTSTSATMDSILKLSIPLLRQEKWRIRNSIYYNRTTKKKAERELSNDLIRNYSGFLRNVNYVGLLKLFQSENVLQLQCSSVSEENTTVFHHHHHGSDNDRSISSSSSSSIDNIRHIPEIMMRMYSYLPIRDRIYGLALVDKMFSKDKIRAGIVSATYGKGFNLKQALLELKRWSLEEMLSDEYDDDDEKHPVDTVTTSLLSLRSISKSRLKQHQRQQYHMERTRKISRMLEAANLTDSEVLLFTGSNLINNIVSPSEREKWITSYVREFFDERQQQQQQQQGQWLTDVTLVQTFLRHYFFDEKVNRLEHLIKDAGFQKDFESYKSCQDSSKNRVDGDGRWIWCLPELYPGCNLLLLDPDSGSGGWKEHRFVSCGLCEKLHEHNKSNKVSCHHEHQRYFCNDCYPAVMPLSPTSFSGSDDTTLSHSIRQRWIESIGPTIICANCRDIPRQMKLLEARYAPRLTPIDN